MSADGDDPERESASPRALRGFASMTPERRRECASKGGKNAALSGNIHKFNSETARAAARKLHASGRAYHMTTEQARERGLRGVAARKAKKDALMREAANIFRVAFGQPTVEELEKEQKK